jgi:hypothetical protein
LVAPSITEMVPLFLFATYMRLVRAFAATPDGPFPSGMLATTV